MAKWKNKFLKLLYRTLMVVLVVTLMVISSFLTVIIRDRLLYNLPNKVSLNNLAKTLNYEHAPFVYVRKSGTYLGDIPSLDTPFFLGSASHIFTATLILALQDSGQLNIDDPVTDYFEHNALPFSEEVKIKHLLNHRAGLLEINGQERLRKIFQEQDHTFTLEEIIKDYTAYVPQLVGQFRYSSTGYHILGKIVEKITGNKLEEEVYASIIEPLELRNTCIYLYDPECDPVKGYVNLELLDLGEGYQQLENYQAYMSSDFFAGNIASSANDLKVFMKSLIENTFFDFARIAEEEASLTEIEPNQEERKLGGRYVLGLIGFGKNIYGLGGRGIDLSTHVVIEKDSGEVYLYYFGEMGITR